MPTTRPHFGLFGGSFDPVHSGHLHVARSAQEAFELQRVTFVPAARPPHKPGRVLASGAHRLAMLEIATASEPTWSVSGIELAREGPSYTVDTVRILLETWRSAGDPECEVHLILGSDNLPGLPSWYRCEELLELVQPVVVMRDEADLESLSAVRARLPERLFERVRRGLLVLPPAPGRASDLRADLAARGAADADERPADLPGGVWEYIRREGLYRES